MRAFVWFAGVLFILGGIPAMIFSHDGVSGAVLAAGGLVSLAVTSTSFETAPLRNDAPNRG